MTNQQAETIAAGVVERLIIVLTWRPQPMTTETLANQALQLLGPNLWRKRPTNEQGAGVIILEDNRHHLSWMSIAELLLSSSNPEKEVWVREFYAQLATMAQDPTLSQDEMLVAVVFDSEVQPNLRGQTVIARIGRLVKQSRRRRRATLRLKK
jgi:hypothetical protein